MAKFNYLKSQSTAARLIAKFGQVGVIRRIESAGDPWNPTQTEVDHTCTFVVLDYSFYELANSLVEVSDRKIYLAPKDLVIEPTVADNIIIGGNAFSILRVTPLNPAGIIVFYELQARG